VRRDLLALDAAHSNVFHDTPVHDQEPDEKRQRAQRPEEVVPGRYRTAKRIAPGAISRHRDSF